MLTDERKTELNQEMLFWVYAGKEARKAWYAELTLEEQEYVSAQIAALVDRILAPLQPAMEAVSKYLQDAMAAFVQWWQEHRATIWAFTQSLRRANGMPYRVLIPQQTNVRRPAT